MLCQLVHNNFLLQSPEFTQAGQALEVGNLVVDRLTQSLYALTKGDAEYNDTLWSSKMSGQHGDTVIKLWCRSKSLENVFSPIAVD